METIDEQRKEFAEHIGSKLYDRIRKRGNYCDGDVQCIRESIKHLLKKENWIKVEKPLDSGKPLV